MNEEKNLKNDLYEKLSNSKESLEDFLSQINKIETNKEISSSLNEITEEIEIVINKLNDIKSFEEE